MSTKQERPIANPLEFRLACARARTAFHKLGKAMTAFPETDDLDTLADALICQDHDRAVLIRCTEAAIAAVKAVNKADKARRRRHR